MNEYHYIQRIRITSIINGLLGISLILLSCWLGAFDSLFALTTLIVGALVLLGSSLRFSFRGTRACSWLNAIAGAWLIVAPQIVADADEGIAGWISIFAGALIAGFACLSLTFRGLAHAWTLPRPDRRLSRGERP